MGIKVGYTKLVTASYQEKTVFFKMEMQNPSGSIKDRTALSMIDGAKKSGFLTNKKIVADGSSGSFGISLTMVGAQFGLKAIILSHRLSNPLKIAKINFYGGEVWPVEENVSEDHPASYSSRLRQLQKVPGLLKLDQMLDPNNPLAHYTTTGPEIWQQTRGQVCAIFCGIGTGGTISGLGRFFKEKNKNIKIVGLDPEGSVYADHFNFEKLVSSERSIIVEGVGDKVISGCFDPTVIDHVMTVSDTDVRPSWQILENEFGLNVGMSSALTFAGYREYQKRYGPIQNAVLIFPNSSEFYVDKFTEDLIEN